MTILIRIIVTIVIIIIIIIIAVIIIVATCSSKHFFEPFSFSCRVSFFLTLPCTLCKKEKGAKKIFIKSPF